MEGEKFEPPEASPPQQSSSSVARVRLDASKTRTLRPWSCQRTPGRTCLCAPERVCRPPYRAERPQQPGFVTRGGIDAYSSTVTRSSCGGVISSGTGSPDAASSST